MLLKTISLPHAGGWNIGGIDNNGVNSVSNIPIIYRRLKDLFSIGLTFRLFFINNYVYDIIKTIKNNGKG